MKPYGATTDNYGNTGCCPGHDDPYIKKWSGMYSNNQNRRIGTKVKKKQNRARRRKDKKAIKKGD